MNRNSQHINFSYYELSLLAFLRESHPDRAGDIAFIKARAQQAAEAYSDAFLNGFSVLECAEIASRALYRGLHFSKHDTIVAVLWSEFSADIPAEDVVKIAINLQPSLEEIFAKYTLDDDFVGSPLHQSLYTELTGAIQLKLEQDGSL